MEQTPFSEGVSNEGEGVLTNSEVDRLLNALPMPQFTLLNPPDPWQLNDAFVRSKQTADGKHVCVACIDEALAGRDLERYAVRVTLQKVESLRLDVYADPRYSGDDPRDGRYVNPAREKNFFKSLKLTDEPMEPRIRNFEMLAWTDAENALQPAPDQAFGSNRRLYFKVGFLKAPNGVSSISKTGESKKAGSYKDTCTEFRLRFDVMNAEGSVVESLCSEPFIVLPHRKYLPFSVRDQKTRPSERRPARGAAVKTEHSPPQTSPHERSPVYTPASSQPATPQLSQQSTPVEHYHQHLAPPPFSAPFRSPSPPKFPAVAAAFGQHAAPRGAVQQPMPIDEAAVAAFEQGNLPELSYHQQLAQNGSVALPSFGGGLDSTQDQYVDPLHPAAASFHPLSVPQSSFGPSYGDQFSMNREPLLSRPVIRTSGEKPWKRSALSMDEPEYSTDEEWLLELSDGSPPQSMVLRPDATLADVRRLKNFGHFLRFKNALTGEALQMSAEQYAKVKEFVGPGRRIIADVDLKYLWDVRKEEEVDVMYQTLLLFSSHEGVPNSVQIRHDLRKFCTEVATGGSDKFTKEKFELLLTFFGSNYIRCLERLHEVYSLPFFHGLVSTEKAHDLLRATGPGSYLFRYSNRYLDKGYFALTCQTHKNEVCSYIFRLDENNKWRTVPQGQSFDTIQQAVGVLDNLHLCRPVPRPAESDSGSVGYVGFSETMQQVEDGLVSLSVSPFLADLLQAGADVMSSLSTSSGFVT